MYCFDKIALDTLSQSDAVTAIPRASTRHILLQKGVIVHTAHASPSRALTHSPNLRGLSKKGEFLHFFPAAAEQDSPWRSSSSPAS